MSEKKPYPYLAPCPFCTIDLMEVAEVDGGLVDLVYPINLDRTIYSVNCPEHAGGCNASMIAGTREEAIAAWNKRVLFTRPHGNIADLSKDEMFHAYMELNQTTQWYIAEYHKHVDLAFIADKKHKKAMGEVNNLSQQLFDNRVYPKVNYKSAGELSVFRIILNLIKSLRDGN